MLKRSMVIASAACCLVASLCSAATTSPTTSSTRSKPTASHAVVAASGPAALERAFWDCDHAASSRLMDVAEAAECSAVSEAVLRTFDGNFPAMLAWWERNKFSEHRTRERAIGRDAP